MAFALSFISIYFHFFFIYLMIIILSLKARRIYFLENMDFAFSPMCASVVRILFERLKFFNSSMLHMDSCQRVYIPF